MPLEPPGDCSARKAINRECFRGGDDEHTEEVRKAERARKNCERTFARKCVPRLQLALGGRSPKAHSQAGSRFHGVLLAASHPLSVASSSTGGRRCECA